MINGDFFQSRDYVIDITAVSHTDGDSNAMFFRWPTRFIDDLAVSNHAIGNGYLDVIAR